MSETIIIALIAFSAGFLNDANKPKQYSLELAGGESENILVESNGNYACPAYCATDHLHTAIMCEPGKHKHASNQQLQISLLPNEKMSFNGQAVLAMELVQKTKKKSGKAKETLASK